MFWFKCYALPSYAVLLFIVKQNSVFTNLPFICSVRNYFNFIKLYAFEMSSQPAQLRDLNSFFIFGCAVLACPAYDSNSESFAAKVVQLSSQPAHVKHRLSSFIGIRVFCYEVVKPIIDAVQVANCAVKIEPTYCLNLSEMIASYCSSVTPSRYFCGEVANSSPIVALAIVRT